MMKNGIVVRLLRVMPGMMFHKKRKKE